MKGHKQEGHPPGWLNRLLLWFCDDDLIEEIEGDLYEEYQDQYREYGIKKANKRYLISVIKFLKPRFMQKLSNTQDYVPRVGNYLKVALRNFRKHSLIGSINLLGFVAGLSVMILAGEYLYDQLSADRTIPENERVQRVVWGYRSQVYSNLGFQNSSRSGQLEMARALKEVPEVEEVAQFATSSSALMEREFFIAANGREIPEEEVLFTNTPAAFQKVFQWPVLAGSLQGALNGKVLLTETTAFKFFGKNWQQQAVDSEFTLGETRYLVKAVVADVPDNSHMSFNVVAMVDSIPYAWGAYTYVKLNAEYEKGTLDEKITKASYKVKPNAENDPLEKGLYLQPVTDIHMGSDHLYELESNLDPVYAYLFGIIGLIVLAITATNYLNLSVAMYSNRLKEIGVRKVIGARKKDIRFQFLFESVFTTIIALPIALVVVYVVLPTFNDLLQVQLQVVELFSIVHISLFLSVTLLIGLLCGVYPSAILAGRPLLSLLGKKTISRSQGLSIRKTLIGFQFLLLMVLSGFAFYVNSQLSYIKEKELGFDKEGVVAFGFTGAEAFGILKQELLKNPNVLEVGNGSLPGENPFNTMTYQFEGVEEVFDDANQLYMDLGAAKVLGLWSDAFTALENGKSRVVVINETAAKKYEQASGKARTELIGRNVIEAPEDVREDGTMGYPQVVDGFIDDFHYFSLRENHNPLVITVFNEMGWVYYVQVKVNTASFLETVNFIEETYYAQEKGAPFNPVFLEDRLERLYGNENRIAKLVALLSYLSVFLAFAGLVGLTYYMARLRQREVAIRKVLGARVVGLLGLMSREFVYIALAALVIAVPFTMFIVSRWLENFAFHITPSIVTLLLLGVAGTALMLIAVVGQSYHTARHNPVATLNQD